jgi:hypothetical protein
MPYDDPHELPFTDIDILVDAQGRIASDSTWAKYTFKDGDRLCLVAALSLASGSRCFNAPNETEQRLARILAHQLPPDAPILARLWFIRSRQRLMWFNDSRRASHADVLAVFDRAIEHLAIKVPSYASA